MPWYIKVLVIIMLFGIFENSPNVALLLSILFLIIAHFFTVKNNTEKNIQQILSHISQLEILKKELKRLYELDELTSLRYSYLVDKIDEVLKFQIQNLDNYNKSKHELLLDQAWELLRKSTVSDIGIAPWKESIVQKPIIQEPVVKVVETSPLEQQESEKIEVIIEELPIKLENKVSSSLMIQRSESISEISGDESKQAEFHSIQSELPKISAEKTRFNKIAFIAKIIFPFLWQNIGWFIGGFCIISGLSFFVLYSSGFAKGIAVLSTLCVYASGLFFGGYQLRKKRPELLLSSNVLLTLSILLIPLAFAVLTRLIVNNSSILTLSISLFLLLIVFISSFWMSNLASSLIERQLQNKYAYFFIALSVLQLTLPIIVAFPQWLIMAVLHSILFLLLAYTLIQFTESWLKSIFLEQRKTAYYTAGTLIYATLVSFIHLTWGSSVQLPQGYSAPFIMALCGLIFYVDVQVKQWVEKRVLLSRLSFLIYGLSALAVLIAYPNSSALILTLSLGAVLYAIMVWKYLSLIPVYLLLFCLSGLYGLLILKHFSADWHFLISLPALSSLLLLQKFAQKRHSQYLVIAICRIIVSIAAGLLIWSLLHAQPSFIAAFSALLVTILAIRHLYVPPACPVPIRFERYKCYSITVLSFVTLVYIPPLFNNVIWTQQFTVGLMILVAIWMIRGLKAIKARICDASVFLNSVLLGLAFSMFLVANEEFRLLPWHAVAVGLLLLWFSLGLRVRAAFYIALLFLGLGGAVLKKRYFPDSLGIGMMFLALSIWSLLAILLNRLRMRNQKLENKNNEIGEKEPTRVDKVTLLGKSVSVYHSRLEMVIQPLKVALVIVWLAGLGRILLNSMMLFTYWNNEPLPLTFAVSTGLASIVTVLIAGQLRQLKLLPLAFILSISTLLVITPNSLFLSSYINGLTIISIYSLFLGMMTVFLLKNSKLWTNFLAWQGGYDEKGGMYASEYILHRTVFILHIFIIFLAIWGTVNGIWSNTAFTFGVSAIFFALAGYRYHSRLHSYLLVVCIVFSGLIPYISYKNIYLLQLIEPQYNIMLLAILAVLSALIAHILYTYPKLCTLYSYPLYHISGIAYILALLGALYLLDKSEEFIFVPFVFILLAFEHAILSRLFTHEASLRGIGIVLLLTFSLISFSYSGLGGTLVIEEILILWGFILWISSHYLLVPFNKRFPNWTITPHFWGELGLLFVLGSLLSSISKTYLPPWHILAGVSLYLLLMLNDIKQLWLHWLTAFVISLSGIGVFAHIFPPQNNDETLFLFAFSTVIWANLLLDIAPLWRHYAGKYLKSVFRLRGLDTPFNVFSTIILFVWLILVQIKTIYSDIEPSVEISQDVWIEIMLLSFLLIISFSNVLNRHKNQLTGHFFILSVCNSVILLWNQYHFISLPMLLTIWTLALSFLFKSMQKVQTECRTRRFCVLRKCKIWLPLSFVATLISLIVTHDNSVSESLLTLFFLSALSFIIGLQHRIWQWLVVSVVLTILLLHVDSILWFPDTQIMALLPFSTLQLVILVWIIYSLRFIEHLDSSPLLAGLSGITVPFLANFIALEWLLHSIHFLNCHISSWGIGSSICAFNPLGSWAAIVAMMILIGFWFRYNSGYLKIYGLTIMIALLLGYTRVFLFGVIPFTLWDTGVLIIISYVLFIVQKVTDSPHPAIRRLTVIVPLLTLVTIPFQLNSIHASLSLVAIATLYLLLQRESQRSLPLYLSLLLFNLSIYLWIPNLQQHYGLIQIYIIPAALTVLIMLQLHDREIKPSVGNAARLAALSSIYVSATIDAFLRHTEISVFLLALGLSLLGVILGIALRIRAFLYTGTLFLVLYISVELFSNFPKDGELRGIIIMITGVIITGSMVWFNLQREKLIQRWQIIRGDLATWR